MMNRVNKMTNKGRPWIAGIICGAILLSAGVLLGGCASSEELTKAELAIQEEAKEKQKAEMAEKKILSDFQNKAYKIYTLKQMTSLTPVLNEKLPKLSKENAVKMILNFELSQRMALQNDPKYGAVSAEMTTLLNASSQMGMIDFSKITLSDENLKEELEDIQKGYFAVYKDENGIYRLVDYSKLQQFKSYLSDEYGQYIDYMATENGTPSIKNKGLNVSMDEAWRRILMLDQFFTDYPVTSDDLMRNNLGRYYQDLIKYVIYGNDQRINFDLSTQQMKPEPMTFITNHQFNASSKLYIPFENFKTQLILDKGILTPSVGTHIQAIQRISEEMLTDIID